MPDRQLAAGGTLWRFYAYRVLSGLQFFSAIWIIFLRSRGFSLTEVGFAISAFHLAPLLLEAPAGVFADLVGRRWSLALSAALVALSCALIYVAQVLPLVLAAMFLSGASYSFRSGADQAYLYDALGARQPGFAGILGKLLGVSYLVAAGATWLGASLSDRGYGWPYGLTIAAALGALWLATGLTEPPRVAARREAGVTAALKGHARESWQLLRGRRDMSAMLLFSGPFWAVSTVAFLYFQAAFAERGLSNGDIGLLLGAATVVGAMGAASAARLERVGRVGTQIVALAGLTGVGLLGVASGSLPLALAAYFVANLANGVVEPVLLGWFNQQLPSEQRATLLSIEAWLVSLTIIVAFPAAGWLAGAQGWGVLYVVSGGVKLTLGLALLLALWRRGGNGSRRRASARSSTDAAHSEHVQIDSRGVSAAQSDVPGGA